MQSPKRNKRPRGTPTFLTPVRANKRVPLREIDAQGTVSELAAQRTLATSSEVVERKKHIRWSQSELRALVEFVLLHCESNSWPAHMNMEMWEAAGQFIKTRTGKEIVRSRKDSSLLS